MDKVLYILVMLFIYDIVGYTFIKKITGSRSFYSLPLGFLIVVSLFHIMTLPVMLYKLSFSIVLYPITLVLLMFITGCIYTSIFRYDYLKYQLIKYKSPQFYIACFFAMLYGIFIIIFASDADQYLYQKMVQVTLDTNKVYSNINDPHELNSIYLYNSLLIKIFDIDVFSYTYGIFRFIESFFYIFLLYLYNQYAFKNKTITSLMLVAGMFGFQTFSISAFNSGLKLTQLFGNSGTYTLMYAMPFLYSLNLFIKKPNNIYILFLIFISPFAFTTTLYPFAFYFMLLYYYVYDGEEKDFLYIFILYLYNIFYYLLLMNIPILIAGVFIGIVSLTVVMRICYIYETKSSLKKFYFYILLFHMLVFLVLNGITLYFTASKLFILICLLVYYKKYGFDKLLKYSSFILFIYFIYFNNYSETNLLVMARRIIAFVPINIYYQVFLLNKKIVKLSLYLSVIIISYLFYQQTMLYAPKIQIQKQNGLYVPLYKVENMYDYSFKPEDKVYQQTFNPRVYNLGKFIFSTNPKQCPSNDLSCVCEIDDDCYLVLMRYQQTDTYDYLYNNYDDIVSEEEYNIIRKTNDQEEINKWIHSQLRE